MCTFNFNSPQFSFQWFGLLAQQITINIKEDSTVSKFRFRLKNRMGVGITSSVTCLSVQSEFLNCNILLTRNLLNN